MFLLREEQKEEKNFLCLTKEQARNNISIGLNNEPIMLVRGGFFCCNIFFLMSIASPKVFF